MGIENGFLRELPALAFLVLGIVAQIYLVRVFSISRKVAVALFVCQGLIFVSTFEPFSIWLKAKNAPAESALFLYWWIVTPAAVAVWLARKFASRKQFDPRRRALLEASALSLAAVPAAALGFGIVTRKDLTVHEVPLYFRNLPKDLLGLRLVQLSDIHIGPFYRARDLARAVDAANGLRADIMLVTGDLITTRYDPLDECIGELKRLRAASGLWGCLGNHEMHAKLESATAHKGKAAGLRFLRGENQMLRFGDARLNLVGVDHQKRDRPYLEHTPALIDRDAFNVLLSHNPDVFPVAEKQGFQLTISGHTHGGQINFEFAGANYNVADLVTPFTKGAYRRNDSSLYVNSGLGTIGVPVRLGAPPEVTLITLCNS